MNNLTEYISIKEFAKQIGITRQAVHKQIVAGVIKADRVGREFLINKMEVTKYLQERTLRSSHAQRS
jgi:excisionase family DNA binding protein